MTARLVVFLFIAMICRVCLAAPDAKALAWHERNPWFGSDKSMTEFALGVHEQLKKRDPASVGSDDYYREIDKALRARFPAAFGGEQQKAPEQSSRERNPMGRQLILSLDEAKTKCLELGFKAATEGYGKCVLQLSQ